MWHGYRDWGKANTAWWTHRQAMGFDHNDRGYGASCATCVRLLAQIDDGVRLGGWLYRLLWMRLGLHSG